ncbi:MAG: RidA family protein [Cyanobacteria bacterium P01_A01_bin.17]
MIQVSRRQILTTGTVAGLTAAFDRKALGEKAPMSIERKNYEHLDTPVGPYVHAVSYSGLLFLSGMTAFDTPAQGQDLASQARAVFSQLKSILEAEATGFESLLKVTIFVTEFGDVDSLRAVLFSAYGDHLPASSLVRVTSLFAPDLKIEVEATAALPQV